MTSVSLGTRQQRPGTVPGCALSLVLVVSIHGPVRTRAASHIAHGDSRRQLDRL